MLYNPPAGKCDRYDSAVLVSRTGPGCLEAFWTYRREVIEDVGAYIRRTL
jgi:hypothetical protein